MNPLLNTNQLPAFSQIQAKDVEPAIDQVLSDNRNALTNLLEKGKKTGYSWQNLIAPLQQMESRLDRVWSPVRHLNSVMNSEELRLVHDACIPKLSEYATELSQNQALYQAYKSIQQTTEFSSFTKGQQRTIENALLNFELGGVALDDDSKIKFKKIKSELSSLTTTFSQHVLDATNQWKKFIADKEDLAGLPVFALDLLKQNAQLEKQTGYLVTLDFPSFSAVMTYAENRDLRKEVYQAFVTRASELADAELDNTPLLPEILDRRKQLASLLGFDNYAEYSICRKMAETTDQVLDFLYELNSKSHQPAILEHKQLTSFAEQQDGLDQLNAWDVNYYAEKMKQQLFEFSQEDLKPYFPANKVIQGLFEIVSTLFDITLTQKTDVDVWHEDVLFYEIYDSNLQLRGQFYLDLYARKNKKGGAWMDECINRYKNEDHVQTPVAYLTCNLTPPVGDNPALFDHNEVTTLFHEFGHGLHHMLTQVDEYDVSGINGVEWDAVELPSQFLENWCWEKQPLAMISAHYQNGEAIPDDLFEKMLQAKNYRSASAMIRQLEFAIFDFELHLKYGTENYTSVQQMLDEVREKVAVAATPEFNRFQNSFTHIFAGGYAAGYYSYKWAEVLSADAFSRFEEKGIFDSDTGKAFRTEILEKGGSRKAFDNFVAFMHREPKVDALLRHSGLS